jgi:hypothetical protein
MIPYIYYPSIDLDLGELELIVRSIDGKFITDDRELFHLTFIKPSQSQSSGMLKYQRKVEDYPYMTEIQKQIPILGSIFNIYIFLPNEIVKTHIDSNRLCALNIPLSNTSDSSTFFYNRVSNKKQYISNRTLDEVEEGDELFRFNMNKPVVFNTTIPHKVINHQLNYRISISWGFDCSFVEAVQFFESMRVL